MSIQQKSVMRVDSSQYKRTLSVNSGTSSMEGKDHEQVFTAVNALCSSVTLCPDLHSYNYSSVFMCVHCMVHK